MIGDRASTAGRERARSVADLQADFERTDLSRHLALFYDDVDVQREVAAAFVDQGLRTNHRCLYLADANTVDHVEHLLSAYGVDVPARTAAGDLRVASAEDVYLDSGFDPDGMIRALEDACEDSVADGYDGVWVAGENTWCFHTDVGFDHVVDFEADFDQRCPDLPVTALCQYDVSQFCERSVAKALWTHEQVVYRYAVCENPYYVPPQAFRSSTDRDVDARLMLEQLYDLAHHSREVERREQRLSVVTRVLRHNIRNDMNAVTGYLSTLADDASLSPEQTEYVETALEYAAGVVETAERARYVEETLASTALDHARLGDVLDDAADRATARNPGAVVAVDGDTDVDVLADENLDVALAELVENALDHRDDDRPTVALRASEVGADVVAVDVAGEADGIPAVDRRALEGGRESQLTHASGLRLWLAKWVVENAAGDVAFPQDGDDYRIRVRLRRVDGRD